MTDNQPNQTKWQFWIDRGGTFTDIVAQQPDGSIRTHKLLSENPERYPDAAIQGIRDLLGVASDRPLPLEKIACVKMGTTVATNALLERQGEPTVLLITKGFRDALRLAYQNRPDIFARQIVLPEMLYAQVIEIPERHSAQGEKLQSLEIDDNLQQSLQAAYDQGIRACAIVLMHSYRYPDHELQLAELATSIGFPQISLSHQVSSTIKLVGRGDTTVVDAYLSPILQRYVAQVRSQLGDTPLLFMQSNGGLTAAQHFQGKDSILSGPAGGLVGAIQTSAIAGFDKIIGFDMGGTSTDVSHFAGEYERNLETTVAGVRLRVPQLAIHTVAAGGGSILFFDGNSYRVGPASAGANPGPACYGRGGPLTITDCNVMVGKVRSEYFPALFGLEGDRPLDTALVHQRFQELARTIPQTPAPEEVAAGFLAVAIDKMTAAIKKISTQRGYDLQEYALCCFGGAGGQHACAIAKALGMSTILIHPYAGVLSAYGIGLAEICAIQQATVELLLSDAAAGELLADRCWTLELAARQEAISRGAKAEGLVARHRIYLRYSGTDAALAVDYDAVDKMQMAFADSYRQQYGFAMIERDLTIEAVAVEVRSASEMPVNIPAAARSGSLAPINTVDIYSNGGWQQAQVYQRSTLQPGDIIIGPALILESTGTTILEIGWRAIVGDQLHLILEHSSDADLSPEISSDTSAHPVQLEIFNNLFRSIAEEMGIVLQNTSYSVNIKERLDFSCAIFDRWGQLVANAPHIPVHLGSMGASVAALIESHAERLQPDNVYISNNPYHGGTHLPDITAITPVFIDGNKSPVFYLAARGHHADIGGITPGSMPADSTTIQQEGILFDNWLLVEAGRFREDELMAYLAQGGARNPQQNLGDLQAQIAANERGQRELRRVVERYGLAYVQAYMQHIQDRGELAVRQVIGTLAQANAYNQLQTGSFSYQTDEGSKIQVRIEIDAAHRSAKIDFTGTSSQQANNFNAPLAICQAAVLYVFRTLVDDDIPLNAGCLKPLEIIVPEGCMLNPVYPAAVVAGNVETSQAIVNALYGALGNMAAAQGTMNNLIFGNDRYQYYETIAGGSGAGEGFAGADGVQTHMTNSRLTDPEVLELRFPVVVEEFSIRANSGGPGRYRGGHGTVRQILFREPMTVSILSSSRSVPPFGLAGGGAGALGRNVVQRRDGTVEILAGRARVEMAAGDRLLIETPGGGGWGYPGDAEHLQRQ
jgi:5-oxoprolinase (ATP-hydrolysing)